MVDIYKVVLCAAIQNAELMSMYPASSSFGQRRYYTSSYAVLVRQYNRILYPFEVIINDI